VIVGAVGAWMTTLTVVDEALPQALRATAVKSTYPFGPAWNVIASPVVAEVIVPPVICQVYVIPSRCGTEAVFSHELAQTEPGAVISNDATYGHDGWATEIVTEDVAFAQPSLAVTVSVTTPEAPAWNVIESELAADVIVPPEISHWWLIPDRAWTYALPVEFDGTEAGA
jgi:hypothetical protein